MKIPIAVLHQVRDALGSVVSLDAARYRPDIGELWEHYVQNHVGRRLTAGGQSIVHYSWNNLALHFEDKRAHEITQAWVDQYEDLRREGRIGRPSSSGTIRRELAYLLAAINAAAKQRLISKDDVPEIKLPPAPAPRQKWLSVEQIQCLLDALASMRRKDERLTRCERFAWIAVETAQRKTAILRLTWDRVDLEHGIIDFREPGAATTNKRRGVVAISSTLGPILQRALSEKQSRFVLDRPADDVWHTLNIAGQKAGFGGAPTPKGKCAKSAGVSPHVLRHSAATWMARNGVPLFHVAGVLANSVQITERVYAHQMPARPEQAVNLISRGRLHLRD